MSRSKSALTQEHSQRWPGETQVENGASWVLMAMDATPPPRVPVEAFSKGCIASSVVGIVGSQCYVI